MKRLKFEHRITALYLILGALWILFSDKLLGYLFSDIASLSRFQTFKGVFYVVTTAVFFYFFITKHLIKLRNTEKELENHKQNLTQLVHEKTKNLDDAIEALSKTNQKLNEKNKIINKQNTELKSTLKALKEMQFQLIQIEKMASLGILTAGISHEINNPLNFIMGGLTGLQNYIRESKIEDEKVELYLKSIKTGIERATSIMNGLNQLSRNNDDLNEKCDLHAIIENSLAISKGQWKSNIEVIRQFAAYPILIPGNVGKLHQVFINLIVNAFQSIGDKGTVTITTETQKDKAIVTIADTGCGISKDKLSKITDPFYTTKEPGHGTGLGLSITYNIIQDHKGTLEFKSAVKKGTTVTVVLPAKFN
jgi:signal transduction histidine kinase